MNTPKQLPMLLAAAFLATAAIASAQGRTDLAPRPGDYLFSVSGKGIRPDPQVVSITKSDEGHLLMTLQLAGEQLTSQIHIEPDQKRPSSSRNYSICFQSLNRGKAQILVLYGQINESNKGSSLLHGVAVDVSQSREHSPGGSAALSGTFTLKTVKANKTREGKRPGG